MGRKVEEMITTNEHLWPERSRSQLLKFGGSIKRWSRSTFVVLVLLVFSTGCAWNLVPATPGAANHMIMIHAEGRAMDPSGANWQADGNSKYEAHLDRIMENIGKSGKKKILIFVHGGLLTRNASTKMTEDLYREILSDDIYPIFINWEASLWSSLADHLFIIRQGEVSPFHAIATSPFYLAADLGRAITRAPTVWTLQVSSDFKSFDPAWRGWGLDLADGVNDAFALSQEIEEEGKPLSTFPTRKTYRERSGPGYEKDERGFLDQAISSSTYIITIPTKYVLSPIIDAFGQSAWKVLLRRTKNTFHPASTFSVQALRQPDYQERKLEEALDAELSGPAPKLMEKLNRYVKVNGKDNYKITLIAHSMGTFIADQILHHHGELSPAVNITNIVYMAAASSVRDMEKNVIPYLEQHKETTFYNLSLHRLAEVRDRWRNKYTLWIDLPPRGSLLAWIDNFLAQPETVADRTLGSWENVRRGVHLIPKKVRGRVHLKTFDVGMGPEDERLKIRNPEKHGEFNEKGMLFWRPEFWRAP